MGKAKRIKKNNFLNFGVIEKNISKILIPSSILIIFFIAVFIFVSVFIFRSDYFQLKSVGVKASFLDQKSAIYISNQVLKIYKGRNIFKINLSEISSIIQKTYGDIKDLEVKIALPDKIIISMKLRKAVALLKNKKYYPIDSEGVILPGGVTDEFIKNLPVIEGIDLRANSKTRSYQSLRAALNLLDEIRQARFMSQYGVSVLDAGDPRNIAFTLKNGIEVRIGGENFKDRLEALSMTLRDPRLVVGNVKYIDLRFKDIIIGPK